MYCQKCGTQLDENGQCPNCGMSYAPNAIYTQQYERGSGCWGIGGIIASVALGAAYIAYFMLIAVMQVYNPGFMDSEGAQMMVGFGILAIVGLNAFALALSIAGIFIGKNRAIPAIATAFNAIEIVGVLAMIVLGNLAD